jgi:hypothetical protein
MRVIIAGSRTITDAIEVEKAIKLSGFQITEVISGGAQGVDSLGASWANTNKIPCSFFMADWKQHGKAAGPIRNSLMASEAEALILVWDGQSRGSNDMLNKANAKGLKVFTHLVLGEKK